MKIPDVSTVVLTRMRRFVEAACVPAPVWEKSDLRYRFSRVVREARK